MKSLINGLQDITPVDFETCWSSPANIAFVKYWGKKGHQIPANPSLSLTLNDCKTTTSVKFSFSDELDVSLNFDGSNDEKFAAKIKNYLLTLQTDLPWIHRLGVEIKTTNTFPHGAGIASSASGLSAFALCLADYIKHLTHSNDHDNFLKQASFLSRLASGSACRSIYGGFTTWGESELLDSTDFYATPLRVHSELKNLCDSILVINSQEKNVSSRAGHGQMGGHAFAEARYIQARDQFNLCVSALKHGDIEAVGKILEAEAFSLHAMMLTSPNPYTLLKPNSLAAIEILHDFRKETGLPVYFTLDAGPNLHLIYPESHKNKVLTFIGHELASLCEDIIYDRNGEGPVKCY
jgi:diphosphomevalonate decarboxylase